MFNKVIVFASASKDVKLCIWLVATLKSIGKSSGVKVSSILFTKVSISVSALLSAYGIGIVIGDTFCKYR